MVSPINAAQGALSLGDLANNIASATKGLAVAFGLANPEPKFPEYPDQGIIAQFQKEHWYKTPSQGLYSFSIEPVGKASVSEFPPFVDNIKSLFDGTFFDGGKSFTEFKLPITPQEITQTENFAVSIKPTQGGSVVNHSGNKYKTLNISGTTGVMPFRGTNGAFRGTGNVIGQPDELKYRSGYEVFQHFRQWMRSYHETKAQAGSETLRMMFRNYKDWEFLYVEPISFTMKRDANKPLLYNYTIQFRVIGVFTIDKPLFDLVVSKLNEVGDAALNSIILIKNNKSVTETITGDISELQNSIGNINLALKAATQGALTLLDISKNVVEKLSYKELLTTLSTFGNAMVKTAGGSSATAESLGASPRDKDPNKTGLDLIAKASNPGNTDILSLKAKLSSLLDNEAGLSKTLNINTLPSSVQNEVLQAQLDAALISRVKIKKTQTDVQKTYDKLVSGVGLGDSTYDSIFGLTPVATENQQTLTDDLFEMMYALSQTIDVCDGILSSDDLFDTNAKLFNKTDSTNGANSIGTGIFSFPNTNAGTKEGFVPDNATLEDIALAELGDTSRWTEIAELNHLKPPYLVSANDTLGPRYTIQSENFTNPTQIKDLNIGYYFLIPAAPVPAGAWTGKGNWIAKFTGGDKTNAANWQFIFPDEGLVIKSIGTDSFLKFENSEWGEVDPNNFLLDGVLKPGDKIKIPTNSAPPPATKTQGPRDNIYTNKLSPSEKALAVDLKLNDNMDLDLTPSGDLNVATGFDNGAQAIVLKLLYEKGSLKKFPSIGTNLTPGKKVPDIAVLRTDITTSLLQDSRIKNVTKINLVQVNSAIFLTFEALFNGVAQPVPITIPV